MGTFADETIQFTPRGGVSNTEIAEAVLPLATYQDSESTVADIAQQIDDKLECIQLGCDVFTLEPAYDRGMYWTIRLYGEVGYSIFQNHLDAVFLNLVKLCDEAVANDWVTIDRRNRYRYQLTAAGYAAGRSMETSSA